MAESSLIGLKTLWEKEKLLVTSNFSFSYSVFQRLLNQTLKNQGLFGKGLVKSYPMTRRQILDSSKLKGFADDNFKFEENGRKLFKPVENTCWLRAISPFSTMFSKCLFPRGVNRRHCVGMG